MSKITNHNNIKSLSDLKFAKEASLYKVKLHEQALKTGGVQFKANIKASAKMALRGFAKKTISLIVLKLFQKRIRR